MRRFLFCLAVVAGGLTVGTSTAQVGMPPKISPAPRVSPAPAPRPAPVPTPRVNGNAVTSNSPQRVYAITRRDPVSGSTTIHKVGITGGTIRPGGANTGGSLKTVVDARRIYAERGLTQTRTLNRSGDGATYSTRVLRTIAPQPAGSPTSRQLALALEKQLVTRLDAKTGVKPAGNKLPASYPFSRLPIK